MLTTMVLITALIVGVLALAYVVTVVFPLFGILRGGYRVFKIKQAEKKLGKEELIAFHRKLGFTMADGGEKKKDCNT
ncbi:MAG: hypothetical protein N2513_02020 [Deltaproteobacteria bacterium]|nr:hypothetical protein [Deltaproteobacteria bacterium]